MYNQKEILDFLAENKHFLKEKFHVVRIGLFGSFARREQSDNSDIDLIVEFEENTPNLFDKKIEIKKFFQDRFNLKVDICREKYIKSRFKSRILNEAIYVE